MLLVNPATTAKPERSFSLTRRIKIWLHSTSTATRFNSLPISLSLIQLNWLRLQINSHQNAILENLFSGGFKMALKFNWKRLFKFYPILIFVFSFFWCTVFKALKHNLMRQGFQMFWFLPYKWTFYCKFLQNNSRNIRKTLRFPTI